MVRLIQNGWVELQSAVGKGENSVSLQSAVLNAFVLCLGLGEVKGVLVSLDPVNEV